MAIVVLTGLDDEATALQAMHAGAQDYLVKDKVVGDVLIRAIRYARERKRAEEATRHLIREQAARASAELSERRARFLAEASRTLASSLDFEATLSTVGGLALPDFQTVLNRAAALDPISYDRQRSELAKELGVRAKTLDDEVSKRRAEHEQSKKLFLVEPPA